MYAIAAVFKERKYTTFWLRYLPEEPCDCGITLMWTRRAETDYPGLRGTVQYVAGYKKFVLISRRTGMGRCG